MNTNLCHYCNSRFTYKPEDNSYTCQSCMKIVQKVDAETLAWMMDVIDVKIERAMDSHVNACVHESNNRYY